MIRSTKIIALDHSIMLWVLLDSEVVELALCFCLFSQ